MRRSKQAGGVLVVAITVLAGLVAVLALAAASQRTANMVQIRRMEAKRARILAEAGLQRALTELQDQVNSPTTINDDWALLGDTGGEEFELGNGTFRVQVIDAASKINLNTAPQAQLELLPLDTDQIDCILDWREESRQARAGGAKDEYYNNLTNGYNTKLGFFQSVDELLLVKGITARDLYTVRTDVERTNQATRTSTGDQIELPLEELITVDSQSLAVNASGQAKLNINQANAAQIVQRAQVALPIAQSIVSSRPAAGYTDIGQVLAVPGITQQNARTILNECTAGGQNQVGKLNLNTVPEEVLLCVPNLPADAASAIVSRQSSGFTELGELLDIAGLNNLTVLQQVAGFFEVNSQSFLVRVSGRSGATRIALQATIILENGTPKIIRIEQPPYSNVFDIWGWESESVTTTTLKGVQ